MPSKKGSIAYENRLARRRMDRKIKRLEKELASGSLTREEQFQRRGEIREIKALRSETYFTTELGERRSQEQARQAAISYDREVYKESAQSLANRNIQAAKEIGSTYFVEPTTGEHIQNPASRYTEAEMRTFFRATQRAWENERPEYRIEAIMRAYNTDDLQGLIDLILSMYPEEIKKWEQQIRKAGLAKNGAEVSEADVPDDFASTDVIAQTQTEVEKVRVIIEARNYESE